MLASQILADSARLVGAIKRAGGKPCTRSCTVAVLERRAAHLPEAKRAVLLEILVGSHAQEIRS